MLRKRFIFVSQLILLLVIAWPPHAEAQDARASNERRVRLGIAAGFDVWRDLGDLRANAPGEFDSGGFVVDFAAHWRIKEGRSSDLLFGLDFGGFANDSDIHHRREDLLARGMYLTPSIKWQFLTARGRRHSVDAGLGYYLVDIAEVESSRFGYSEDQLWEDTSIGAYVGATIDFTDSERERRGGFTLGAKLHFLDFEDVRDEEPFVVFGTLGPNAGRLRGPVIAVQFGYAF